MFLKSLSILCMVNMCVCSWRQVGLGPKFLQLPPPPEGQTRGLFLTFLLVTNRGGDKLVLAQAVLEGVRLSGTPPPGRVPLFSACL